LQANANGARRRGRKNHEKGDNAEYINSNLNFTFTKAQTREVYVALSNTFGFGGHNACVIFKKYSE